MSTISASTTSTTAYKVTADTTGTLVLQTGSSPTTAMTIDGSQNVGIGTSAGTTTVSSGLAINNATAANYPGLEIQTAGVTRMYFNANNAASYIATVGTNPLAFYGNGSERMRIDSSGNVGIGTSSPSYRLDAWTTATSTTVGANTVGAFYSNGNGYDANIRFGDNVNASARIGYTSGSLYFYTNGAERARIDTSGNLLVGTTSASYNTISSGNGYALDVVQTTNNNSGMRLNNAYTTGTINCIAFYTGATYRGAIQFNGTTVSYTSASDYRLKENVQPMTNALATVAALKPVTYTWKENQTAGQGFIAHQLQEYFPEAVSGTKDALDEEGNPHYQGIDTSFLVATLTAAIQEQQALIVQLTQRIETLEAK